MALSLLLAGSIAGTALAAPRSSSAPPERIIFPIVGPATWTDDFGAPRPQGGHEGNDILSDWKAPVVAVEPGTVKIWNRDGGGAAGCMLYLHGRSGTTYLYIHLNEDLTPKNDGKGGCKPGVAFAPGLKDGDRVRAGELLGYVGSSGDAGTTNHLHFELHPNDGAAVSPFRWLKRAERLLYVLSDDQASEARVTADATTMTVSGVLEKVEIVEAEPPADEAADPESAPGEAPPQESSPSGGSGGGQSAQPVVIGNRSGAAETRIRITVSKVELSTGQTFEVKRPLVLSVAPDAVVERRRNGKTRPAKLELAKPGESVRVTTAAFELSLKSQLARPGALSASTILLEGRPAD